MLLFFETRSTHITQTSLKLSSLLTQLFKCNNSKSALPLPVELETFELEIQSEKAKEPQDTLARKLANKKWVGCLSSVTEA